MGAHRSARLFAALVAVALLAPAAASSAPTNDNRSNAISLLLGYANTINNADATIEANEGFTPNDSAGQYCSNASGVNTTQGVKMDHTLWWGFTGDGGPVTVSSDESPDIDTVMAIYEKVSGQLIGCNDDLQPQDPGRPFLGYRVRSEMIIDSVAGRQYLVQLGGCTAPSGSIQCNQPTVGDLTLRVSATPDNDDRANAAPIVAGGPAATTNTGATRENGEPASCANSLYAKTIWFRYTAPAPGTASFSVAGSQSIVNTVLAVYRGSSSVPLACNDDALAGTPGGSSLPAVQPPGSAIEVLPGDYYVQVGGYYDAGFSTVASRHGPMNVQVQFTEDTDIDNDGYHRDIDCDDNAAAIHPGAAEISNNTVDENCDGVRAQDRDLDGALAPPGDDCNDSNAAIRPGVVDAPDNGIDENCDGADRRLPILGVIIRLDQQPGKKRTRIFRLYVTGVPARTTFQLRCVGKQCRKAAQRMLVSESRKSVTLNALLRKTLRRPLPKPLSLRPGTRIELEATNPEFTGRFRSYRFRTRKDPASVDLCIRPNRREAC